MDQSYNVAISLKTQELWQLLSQKTILEAMKSFLERLKPHTKRSYQCSFSKIFEILGARSLLNPNMTLQTFSMCNLENLLDSIRENIIGSQSTKQNRCAAFIAFTRYLCRTTQGMIREAIPLRGGLNPTFQKIRDKADTKALTHEESSKFISSLRQISIRDYLIAKSVIQGAKRIGEVLSSQISQIDWSNSCITYKQSKSSVVENFTKIHYPEDYMRELKYYLFDRTQGYIFISRNNNPVTQPQIYRAFKLASKRAGLNVSVHPHMLRTTCITLLMKMGYHSDEIMRVSGHSNPNSVIYYDKRAEDENLTKQVKII